MDPYLEARWSGVHVHLIAYISEALQPVLPSGLRARPEERVLLEDNSDESGVYYVPDVAVVRNRAPARATDSAVAAVAVPDPFIIELGDPVVDRFVQIVDTRNGNRVVTVIEILSPWNKAAGRLNRDYLKKLDDYRRAGVNVVEIDFLRSPRVHLQITDQHLPADRRAPYLISVFRATHRRWELYPLSLRAPVPAIPVPLRPNDPDVILQLQPLLDRAYTAGGHDDIDYAQPPHPPLAPDDDAWAQDLLRKAGMR
jgi:Uma2 family endonuclease